MDYNSTNITEAELELVKKYESEMIKLLRDLIVSRQCLDNPMERTAGYLAALCAAAAFMACGAMGEEIAPKYLSDLMNRALNAVRTRKK